MKKSQLVAIVLSVGLLLLLLFGFRTKPHTVLASEKERSLNLQSTDVGMLQSEAVAALSSSSRTRIQLLNAELDQMTTDEEKLPVLENLASIWYQERHAGIAGSYAEQIAVIKDEAPAWGIAGTTYAAGIKMAGTEKEKSFCLAKSLNALESAASLDPEEVSYQLNRGIILAENPPAENPMRGVLLLLDLNKKYPENVPVINNIAKFALQTGQLEKAEQRLLRAEQLLPNNKTTNCLFAKLYQAKGEKSKADIYNAKCEN